jgi:hypothetical protein
VADVRFIRITFEIEGVVGRETYRVPPAASDSNIILAMAEAAVLLGQHVLTVVMSCWDEDCVGLMDRFRIRKIEGLGIPDAESEVSQ